MVIMEEGIKVVGIVVFFGSIGSGDDIDECIVFVCSLLYIFIDV